MAAKATNKRTNTYIKLYKMFSNSIEKLPLESFKSLKFKTAANVVG